MKKLIVFLSVMVFFVGTFGVANAELTIIGTAQFKGTGPEYNLIWDDDNNGNSVVWLDYSNGVGTQCYQKDWAAGLNTTLTYNYSGYTVDWGTNLWRLPNLNRPHPTPTPPNDYNITTGEMGHLYYVELGLVARPYPLAEYTTAQLNASVFNNLFGNPSPSGESHSYYWTDNEYTGWGEPSGFYYYWHFVMNTGFYSDMSMYYNDYDFGLAIRTGEVTATSDPPDPPDPYEPPEPPEPSGLTIIGTAQFGGTGPEYNLIWDDDINGNSVVWLDYTNASETWFLQIDWAAGLDSALTYNIDSAYTVDWGTNSWRLPASVAALCGEGSYGDDGTTVLGSNIITSEMGHLFFLELGNLAYRDTSGNYPQTGWGLQNTLPFNNLIADWYWSGTEWEPGSSSAFVFSMEYGILQADYKTLRHYNGYGLAVRSGEVAVNCVDNDEDGYGVCPDCGVANGCTYNGDDCNDGDGSINPGVTEIPCDGIDQGCSGADSCSCMDKDTDGDGYGDPGDDTCPTGPETDCDDGDDTIYPGATEVTCDDTDQDCSGADACSCMDKDTDGDGYGAPGDDTCPSGPETDCNDGDGSINPGATEITCNGVDENCNGMADDAPDSDIDGYDVCNPGDPGEMDGRVADCNDADGSINPGEIEVSCDGIDQDCSGTDDCPCLDTDGDDYGVCPNCGIVNGCNLTMMITRQKAASAEKWTAMTVMAPSILVLLRYLVTA
ncbi:MAG: hypothetical protein JRI70_07815 [Deltaproteobacteria bacterium]|nr:hypothetical protein [Deltaproteobacteria bacterium]